MFYWRACRLPSHLPTTMAAVGELGHPGAPMSDSILGWVFQVLTNTALGKMAVLLYRVFFQDPILLEFIRLFIVDEALA